MQACSQRYQNSR